MDSKERPQEATAPQSIHSETKSSEVDVRTIGSKLENEVKPEAKEFVLEHYRHILQQIDGSNQNVHRFLGIYQGLSSTLAGATVLVFVYHARWGIAGPEARSAIVCLLVLYTLVALFTVLLVLAGIASWFDYRIEECDLTDVMVHIGYRRRPTLKNFYRWHETYLVFFVVVSTIVVWGIECAYLIPRVR